MSTGAARCWGANYYGQLGDDSLTYRSVPVTVTGMATVTLAIAAGTNHTCAIVAGGGVLCWGYGGEGTLGNGSTPYPQKTPVDVTGLSSGATAVTAGANHSCALVGGVTWCWGYNRFGSLGDGTQTQRDTPVLVGGLPVSVTALIRLGANTYHTCAIAASGAPYCWGANSSAQLGDGTMTNRSIATPVANLSSDVIQITGGGDHTCALTGAGATKCWGTRFYGQVGDGTWGFSAVPVYVGNPMPANPIRTFLPVVSSAR
jgi:alpha-tubulin suppressor-like RCC1 family protein